ncbi:tRNA-dependent cyclodipeptide synthase [Streptomyces sp. NPDC048191]
MPSPAALNCYHQLLAMGELLYSRGAARASRNQGHAVVTPATLEGAAA